MFLNQVYQSNQELSSVPAERDSNKLMICPELLISMPSIWLQEISSVIEDGKIITLWILTCHPDGVTGMKVA